MRERMAMEGSQPARSAAGSGEAVRKGLKEGAEARAGGGHAGMGDRGGGDGADEAGWRNGVGME